MISIDKITHFFVSYAMILTLTLFIGIVPSVVITLITGMAKELYDKHDYGLFSWPDLIADMLGILAAIVVILIKCHIPFF